MVKVKPMKKIVRNYVLSTARAMMNYRDHLVEKGFQQKYAKEKAAEYGINMLRAGLGETITPREAEADFRELAYVASILADICTQYQ